MAKLSILKRTFKENKARQIGLLICLAVSLNGNCQSKDTTTWTVLSGGEKAGFTKKWRNSDNSFTEWYQWNDRGRGIFASIYLLRNAL